MALDPKGGQVAISKRLRFMRSTDAILISSARSARKVLYDECGPEFSEKRFAEKALDFAANAYQARAAEGYLGAMSGDHRAEWEEFAESFYGPEGLRWDHPVIYIARCARGFLENGQRYWPAMCHGRGVHIPLCPSRGTHFVRFAELECCQRADGEHNDHLYCDRHFDAATAGELGNASGPVTVASHTPLTEPIEAVPF